MPETFSGGLTPKVYESCIWVEKNTSLSSQSYGQVVVFKVHEKAIIEPARLRPCVSPYQHETATGTDGIEVWSVWVVAVQLIAIDRISYRVESHQSWDSSSKQCKNRWITMV